MRFYSFFAFEEVLFTVFLNLGNHYTFFFVCGLDKANAEVELLVTAPAEVLGADMTIVGLSGVSIDSVCRVAFRTSHTLTSSKRKALVLASVGTNTDNAELTLANEAVCHPFYLIDELKIGLSLTAN